MQHHREGRVDRAQKIYRDVIRIDPGHADALHLLGVASHQQRNHRAAIDLIRRAICASPRAAAYHCNLGVVYRAMGQSEQAADCYRQAIRLDPDYAEAHNNLGHALQSLGCLDDAVDSYERALELCSDYADAQLNLGNVKRDLGQLDETMARYERAVSLNPHDAETRLSRALAMLLLGDLERGFREYEWRWDADISPYKRLSVPIWDGSHLQGGRLLVLGEQGIGDEIMFASCIPNCIERAGHCVVECDSRLVPLLSRSFSSVEFIPRPTNPTDIESLQSIGDVAAQIAIGSLPRLFRTSPASFPGDESFLTAHPAV
jgi:tetratricopeptide (TPR) repeat protein